MSLLRGCFLRVTVFNLKMYLLNPGDVLDFVHDVNISAAVWYYHSKGVT